jgi:hypothetical protein
VPFPLTLCLPIAGLNRGKAALEFEKASQATQAVKHMDGGQLDGSFLQVQVSDALYKPPPILLPLPAGRATSFTYDLLRISSQHKFWRYAEPEPRLDIRTPLACT